MHEFWRSSVHGTSSAVYSFGWSFGSNQWQSGVPVLWLSSFSVIPIMLLLCICRNFSFNGEVSTQRNQCTDQFFSPHVFFLAQATTMHEQGFCQRAGGGHFLMLWVIGSVLSLPLLSSVFPLWITMRQQSSLEFFFSDTSQIRRLRRSPRLRWRCSHLRQRNTNHRLLWCRLRWFNIRTLESMTNQRLKQGTCWDHFTEKQTSVSMPTFISLRNTKCPFMRLHTQTDLRHFCSAREINERSSRLFLQIQIQLLALTSSPKVSNTLCTKQLCLGETFRDNVRSVN